MYDSRVIRYEKVVCTGEERGEEVKEKRALEMSSSRGRVPDVDAPLLASCDDDVVRTGEQEYNAALRAGEGVRVCLFKLCYARAHAQNAEANRSACEIAEEMYEQQKERLAERRAAAAQASTEGQEQQQQEEEADDVVEGVSSRDLLYVLGVANYKAGNLIKSRKYLNEALELYPNFSQAASLKSHVADELVADGLFGLGIVAGGVALIGFAVAAAAGRK